LHGVTFEVNVRESIALLGRNGMGKTTTLDCIAGVLRATSGTVEIFGHPNGTNHPHDVIQRGLGYVPEARGIFPRLTVGENLRVSRRKSGNWTSERLLNLFPDLRGRLSERAGNLSGGQQQMLAIARALSSNPKVLLLDEPSAGLAPLVIDKIVESLEEIHASGVALLIVEQSMAMAARLARRFLIMESGRIVGTATREELDLDRSLLDQHLGVHR
jgi:ABC-type branched-subunit amino acid transport system ATPase component